MSVDFEDCLKLCIEKDSQIISKLCELKEEVEKFHHKCNLVKTTGTAASVVGTAVFVGSLCAAPFTGGLSLLGTAVGIGTTVVGGTTSAMTDVVAHFKTKVIIKNIKDLVESKEEVTQRLNQHFQTIERIQNDLVENGINEEDALFNILKGIADRSLRIDDITNVRVFTRFVTTFSRVQPMFGREVLSIAKLNTRFAARFANLFGNFFKIGTRTTAMRTLGRATTFLSVAVTLVDVILLINDWNSDHMTVDVIEETIDKMTTEQLKLVDVNELIQSLKLTVAITTIDRIPVVAINHFMIEITRSLFSNQMETFMETLKGKSIDFSLVDQVLNDSLGLFILNNLSEKDNNKQLIKHLLDNRRSNTAESSVTVFLEDLLQTLQFDDLENKERSNEELDVINNKVIVFYQEIIDLFVRQQFNCSFEMLTEIPVESNIYLSYHDPFDNITKNKIKNQLIARFPSDYTYIDANAIVNEIAILFLRHMAKEHLAYLHNNDNLESDYSTYTQAIRDCLDFMYKFDVYVDKTALEYWVTQNATEWSSLRRDVSFT